MTSTLRSYLRPSMFLLHVPAALAVTAAILLGLWQTGSWQDRRQDRAAELSDVPPVPLARVLGPDDRYPAAAVGRPVTVAGSWLRGSSVAVAGQDHAGRAGYWSVALVSTCGTPAADCPSPAALPVVLGWSERPRLLAPSGDVRLVGWLQPGEGSGGESDPNPDDAILPSLRISALVQRVDQDLYGAYLILEKPATLREGLVPVTPDSLPDPPTFTALRNLLYGIEWFVFAGFGVFLWLRWTRDEVRKQAVVEDPDLADVALVSDPAAGERSEEDARLPSSP